MSVAPINQNTTELALSILLARIKNAKMKTKNADKNEYITVKGARVHNLKNVDVDIPKEKLVVLTGVSGSGKSSLAFDTLYAEGQRRYVESLSSYARQFLGVMQKPDVDFIEGLSPSIAIDQKSISQNPRSTVGTTTEIYDYMRLLFARIGRPHCPSCKRELKRQTVPEIVDNVLGLANGGKKPVKVLILGPIVKGRKGKYDQFLEIMKQRGYSRVRVDGKMYRIEDVPELKRYEIHHIEVVVDRLELTEKRIKSKNFKQRLTDDVEIALELGLGETVVLETGTEQQNPIRTATKTGTETEHLFTEKLWCPNCEIGVKEVQPNTFSFNSPYGACERCHGLGHEWQINPESVYNPAFSIKEGGLLPYAKRADHADSWTMKMLEAVTEELGFKMTTPLYELTESQLHSLLYGMKGQIYVKMKRGFWKARYEGVIPRLERMYRETKSDYIREEIEAYMRRLPCPDCNGLRLRPEALSVTIDNLNIAEASGKSVTDLKAWIEMLDSVNSPISSFEKLVAKQVFKEIGTRLNFLVEVGLQYLSLDRETRTLAGGEAQRIRLASQIGSGLSGVLYVLDEPSIGLHARDTDRLLQTLKRLVTLGNTVVVVEHDKETMEASDWIVDLGPGAGEKGGRIVAEGTIEEIKAEKKSLTGKYLSGEKMVAEELTKARRKGNGKTLTIIGAAEHNLKHVKARFPLGTFTTVTGVSGSGKSTLVNDILYNALANHFFTAKRVEGRHDQILGLEYLDKVVNVDQSPIGRTPRSNPATYVGFFTKIRDLYASTKEAKARGYTPGRFSFNVKGGRCESCRGDGLKRIEMQFLPDVYVPCEQCEGKRYTREVLEVQYKDKNIHDVLEMTVTEALEFFKYIPSIKRDLELLDEVGLGYIRLGQPAPTLSGGEAQRIKLASELKKRATGKTIYILDEPTTGLHFADIDKLLKVLHRLVDLGNTVVVIEHNLDVIKTADWVIDLGPEGGDKGGQILYQGPLAGLKTTPESYTGRFLAA